MAFSAFFSFGFPCDTRFSLLDWNMMDSAIYY